MDVVENNFIIIDEFCKESNFIYFRWIL